MSRLAIRFAELARAGRAAFVPFVTAGDPDLDTSFALVEALPGAGADVIELGVPFSDPMADGPAIQAASLRALRAGMNVAKMLEMVRRFRARDDSTPIVLMGYYNPVHAYGPARFAADAAQAGADALIVVDLPPEEDAPLREPASRAGLDLVRLIAPTTGELRLPLLLDGAGGYLYYVSIAGITGTKAVAEDDARVAVARIKTRTALPVAVGFGIRTPEQAAAMARAADGVVVGTAVVSSLAEGLARGLAREDAVAETISFVRALAHAVHGARAGSGVLG